MTTINVIAVAAVVLAFLLWRGITAVNRASDALERVGEILEYAVAADSEFDDSDEYEPSIG